MSGQAESKRYTRHRTLRQKYIDSGMCSRCGQRPPEPGKLGCSECNSKRRQGYESLPQETKAEHYRRCKARRQLNPELNAESLKRGRHKLREEVFAHYGSKCACCGIEGWQFLTIDHVENNGNQHRLEIFGKRVAGQRMYRWLKQNGFPPGFQALCWNCNMAKAHFGECPHKSSGIPDAELEGLDVAGLLNFLHEAENKRDRGEYDCGYISCAVQALIHAERARGEKGGE